MSLSEVNNDTEAYADDAPLMALFESPAMTKILSVFVAERGRDLNKSEIARQAGVARSTVYDHLDHFLGLGIIEETRATQAGHSVRYQLNEENDVAEKLYELEGVILGLLLDQE